jgi:NIMA (never in mitosis gene a)-related kinase
MSNLKKYKKIKYLGKGSYGAAILVELRSDPARKFVVKEIVIGHLKPAEQQSAKNEAEVLYQMNHSNITMYIESFVENSKLYIVMEHADGGDLSGAIQQRKSESKYWQEEEVMRIFVQICLALKHVHNANILHRDLKSQNIFLTKKGMVKLGDFGIAKVLDASDDQARTQIGTPYYLSPEICESKPYGRKSDVWSLGVVLYELLALEMPFQASSLPALVHRICTAEPNYSKVETRYSQALVSLCKSLLMKNPEVRPSLNQVVRTDFFIVHISKLLSYTLKSGTGGVLDGNALANGVGPAGAAAAAIEDSYKDIDPDEVEKNIENIRNKERQQIQQNSTKQQQQQQQEALAKEKQSQREEECEKLRRFRQEIIVKKRNANHSDGVASAMGQYRAMDSKESESGRRSPQPSGGRPISPKSPRSNYNDPRKYNPSPVGGSVAAGAPSGSQRGAPANSNIFPRQNHSNSPTSQQSRGGALRNYVNNNNSYGETPSTKSTASYNNDAYESAARR